MECKDGRSYHVTHWFLNTQSEAQRLVLIYSAILSTCFVLKPDGSMFGCVGRTGCEQWLKRNDWLTDLQVIYRTK